MLFRSDGQILPLNPTCLGPERARIRKLQKARAIFAQAEECAQKVLFSLAGLPSTSSPSSISDMAYLLMSLPGLLESFVRVRQQENLLL